MEFKIIKKVATLNDSKSWTKELNIVKWGQNTEKYEIRTWTANNQIAGKGITFTEEELRKLRDALNELTLDF